MPRIWMTYNELGQLLNCSPIEARDYAITRSLTRRKSRGGLTWTELDGQLTLTFIDLLRSPERAKLPEAELDQAIAELQDIYDEMSRVTDRSDQRKQA